MDLHQWNGLIWSSANGGTAYCPKHKGMELDMLSSYGSATNQHSNSAYQRNDRTVFICPVDDEHITKKEVISTLRRRYIAHQNSNVLKGARIIDLDNVYTPILKVEPKPKDKRYSIQVEIDETPQGKKLVIYAADRQEDGKTQVFIDPQTDKLSFDSNDIHPSMIFSKVVAYFKDGKQASMESVDKEASSV
jgi:hypothetical protein